MSIFIKKCGLFIVICLLSITLLNSLYVSLDQRNSDDIKKFKNVPYNIDICNFGSSHGQKGFCYDNLNYNCFNFSLSGQSLSYDYRVLQQYIDHINENGVVFITLSYFSFFGADEVQESNFLSKNMRYYNFLQPNYIKEFNLKYSFLVKNCPILIAYEDLITVFSGNARDDENEVRWNTDATTLNLEKDVVLKYEAHVLDRLDSSGSIIINNEEVASLCLILQLCKDNNLKPILITTPYLSEYRETIMFNHPEILQNFNEIIYDISDSTGVPYYDYSSDNRFSNDLSLFIDVDHLNKKGAELFVNVLIEDGIIHI